MSQAVSPIAALAADRLYASRLAHGYAGLVALTTGLIVLGALVRAHGAGLACPDWPLCFGNVIPTFDLRIAFEWSHRAIAGSLTIFFLGLGALAWRRAYTREVCRRSVQLAAGLLAVQILLGALTVWELLASWTVTSHLLTGNAVNASFLLIWRKLRAASRPDEPRPTDDRVLRALVIASVVLLTLQIGLGGLVSSKFAGLACDEWPTCAGGEWFPGWAGARGIHQLHRLGAYGLVSLLLASAVAARRSPRLRSLTALAAALGLVQAAVGITNVLAKIPVEVTGLHSLLAACLVLCLALCAYETTRMARTQPAREP
jgi:cytochrome c oxidase assembly protein subunit 15